MTDDVRLASRAEKMGMSVNRLRHFDKLTLMEKHRVWAKWPEWYPYRKHCQKVIKNDLQRGAKHMDSYDYDALDYLEGRCYAPDPDNPFDSFYDWLMERQDNGGGKASMGRMEPS